MPFFVELNNTVLEACLVSGASKIKFFDEIIDAITIALREILGRTPRALFHTDLPDLVESFENDFEMLGFKTISLS